MTDGPSILITSPDHNTAQMSATTANFIIHASPERANQPPNKSEQEPSLPHISARQILLSLTKRQKRTLEFWYKNNKHPSRFCKVFLITSFGGDESHIGAIHLWFIVRRRLDRKPKRPSLIRSQVRPRLLSPMDQISQRPIPIMQKRPSISSSYSMDPPETTASATKISSYAMSEDLESHTGTSLWHQARDNTVDTHPYSVSPSRRKSVHKVKEWMGEYNNTGPMFSPESEHGGFLFAPHVKAKSATSSYDEGYHSRSSFDARNIGLDMMRCPSRLTTEFPLLDLSDADPMTSQSPPPAHWDWNSGTSFTFDCAPKILQAEDVDMSCPLVDETEGQLQRIGFTASHHIADSEICPVTLVGAEPNIILEQTRRESDTSNVPSSQVETEDLEDVALSLWSEEVPGAIIISKHVSETMCKWFLDRLLYAFVQVRAHRKGSSQPTEAAQDGDDSTQASKSFQYDLGDSRPSSRENESGMLKRKRKDDDGDKERDSNQKRSPPVPRTQVNLVEDEVSRLLACPFCKWKPLTYRSCQGMVLREISRVKQHLWRNHQIPIHCAICFTEFANQGERDAHLRQRNCTLQQARTWEGITEEQKKELRRRVDPSKSKRDQWYGIFAVLFPGHPLPESPYTERLLSAELIALQDFMAQEWPSMFDKLVESRLPPSLQSQEAVVRTFSTFLFEEAVGTMLDRFGANSSGSVSPDSGYGSKKRGPPPPTISVESPSTISHPTIHRTDVPDIVLTGIATVDEEIGGGLDFPPEYFMSDNLLFDFTGGWGDV